MPDAVAEVVFPIPLKRAFDYRIPPALTHSLRPGHRVWVPFGSRRRHMGLVVDRRVIPTLDRPLKDIDALVDPLPLVSPLDLELARWMAERYGASLGETAFTVACLGKKKPPVRARPPDSLGVAERSPGKPPTRDQQNVLATLRAAVAGGGFSPHLLRGVAAAGKTEVYRACVQDTLDQGKAAIVLVPEIGLTPQMEDLFRGWFGGVLDVWHSGLNDGERWRVWRRARAGECRLVLGPRSALFVPVTPLGLIVIDEEHDPSYKQDSSPHYHARDTAWEKARQHGATLILGSATPSLESWSRARSGEMSELVMPHRVDDRPFPTCHVIDMRKHGWYLSDPLLAAMKERLERGEQTLLYLNRRGYATRLLCREGSHEMRCPHCAVFLVWHKEAIGDVLRCHTCDHQTPLPPVCPDCAGPMIKALGRGTQRVLRDVATLFSSARLLQWDRDSVGRRGAHRAAHAAVKDGDVDIIVGTQMVTQGHDFPRLTLVGVLDADSALRLPDFRSAERTFQRLTQVAGRAGRGDQPGAVYIQTRDPDHYALRAVAARDYPAFAEEELRFRVAAEYPPHTRLALFLIRSNKPERAETTADALATFLTVPGATVLGPAPAFHAQQAGDTLWQVVLKASPALFPNFLRRLDEFPVPTGVSLTTDVDAEEVG